MAGKSDGVSWFLICFARLSNNQILYGYCEPGVEQIRRNLPSVFTQVCELCTGEVAFI